MAESTVVKSKIFKEDVNFATGGTGAVETGVRRTSTGGEVTLTKIDAEHLMLRNTALSVETEINLIKTNQLYTCTSVIEITNAITTIGSDDATIYLIPNSYTLTTDLTFPTNINLKPAKGAIFTIPNAVTLTINSMDAGLYQVFSCTGTGKVVFGSGSVKEVYPEWWAINTSPGITDMSAAVNAAFASEAPTLCLTQTYWIGDITIPAAIDVYGPGKLIGDGTGLVSAVGTLASGVAYGSTIAIGESSFTVANSYAAGDVLLLSNYPATAADRRKELLVVATATGSGFTTTTTVLQTYSSTTSLQFQKVTPIDGIRFDSPNWENHNFSFSLCRNLVIKTGKAKKCAIETKTCIQYSIDFVDFDSQNTGRFLNFYEMNRNFSITGNYTGGVGVSDNALVKGGGSSHFTIDINVNGTINGGGYLHGLMLDPWFEENPTGYQNQTICYFTARVNGHAVYGYTILVTANSTPTDVQPHDFYLDGQWAENESAISLVYAKNGVIAGHGKGGVLSLYNTDNIVVANDNFTTYDLSANTNLQGVWQTFTPVVSGTTGSAPEPAMGASAVGRYIKRGRSVHFRASYIWTDAGSRTGNLVLNVPITMASVAGAQPSSISIGPFVGVTTRTNGLYGAITDGSTVLSLYYDGATALPLEATGTIHVSGTYETAS